MTRQFIGTGWKFNVATNDDGQIALVDEEALVSQSIEIILGTAKGERHMRPEFGCGIHDLIFAVNNATTASRVVQEVREALLKWEPRIDVRDIQVSPSAEQPGLLLIELTYRIRSSNTAYNQVYPFYLDKGIGS
jgi:phage baseplate assembly protein W